MRIVRYLSGTTTTGIVFRSKAKLCPVIYIDASHNSHSTGHGHGGIVITLGSGPIYSRSFKIKSITRSSSESELFTLEDASTYSTWLAQLLTDMHVNLSEPIKIFQDNKSTIIMAVQGGNFKRTKHLICKESYVKERLQPGDIQLKYLPTNQMPADLLTKPLNKGLLARFKTLLSIIPTNKQ